jgi:tetratricopeptide (TPR) repeat protein
MTAALVGTVLALYGAWEGSNRLGNEHQAQARHAEAETAYRNALALVEGMGLPPQARAMAANNLGAVLQRRGRYDEAERYYLESIRAWKDAAPIWEADLARAYSNLGALAMNRGHLEQAASLLAQAREIQDRVHDGALAHTLVATANLEMLRGASGRAEELLIAARGAMNSYGGTRDVEVYWGVTQCGALAAAGRPAEALAACGQARTLIQAGLGDSHPQMATLEMRTGQAHLALGSFEDAAESYRRSATIYARTVGDKSAAYGRALIGMASARRAQKQYPVALAQARRAAEVLEGCGDGATGDRLTALQVFADLLRLQGDPAEAEATTRSALALAERWQGPDSLLVSDILNTLGVALQERPGGVEEASQALERSLAIRTARQGPTHPALAELLANLGCVRLNQGRPKEAAAFFERALALRQQITGTLHPSLLPWLSGYVNALDRLDRKDDVRWARSVARRIAGDPHAADPGAQVLTFTEWKRQHH